MAFPAVEGTATSHDSASFHTVSLPSGIVDGDFLVMFFGFERNQQNITSPTGWTKVFQGTITHFTNAIFIRRADGTEGSTATVSTGVSGGSAHNVYRISGHNPGVIDISASATGTSTSPDPASLTPDGGAKDYLWLAVEFHEDSGDTTAFPTSYTDAIEVHRAAGNNISCASARRELNATSEDPGTFTIANSILWEALTVAIHPAEVGPTVIGTATSLEDAGNVTSHTVTLPFDINSGDLLIICFASDGTPTVTWPSGANDEFTEFATGAANGERTAIAYRQANGSEPSTVEVTTSASERSAHVAYRITGAEDPATQVPEASSHVSGTNASPDPGSLTPTGGAKDYLWLACHGHDRDRTTTAAPTNYAGLLATQGSGANSAGVGCAERHLNASPEDPGIFTISSADGWSAFTVAVHPAAAPAGGPAVGSLALMGIGR